MTDTTTFDAADAAHHEIHVALATTSLTSIDVGALIDRASKHIAECEGLAADKAATAADPTLNMRDALAAKQEGEGLTFAAQRLRNLVPMLDRRLASERDGEDQARRAEQHGQAQHRVAEIVARARKDYPKAVAAIMELVAEIGKADAIVADANRNLPRDAQPVPTVEKTLGADILSRLHLPTLDGALAHEMTGDAAEAFRTVLWNRAQAPMQAHFAQEDEKRRRAAMAERQAAANAHNGPQEEKNNILQGFPPRMVGPGRPVRVA